MRENRLKQRLLRGEAAIGTWVFLGPDVVEIAALAGLDFVIIDAEHSSTSLREIEEGVRAADATGITALARVGSDDPNLILRALETGVQGLVVPKIESGEQAVRVAAAARYPPAGNRGSFGYTRAARYGSVPFAEHAASANDEVLIIGMIETALGVDNADAIAGAGLDGIFIGKSDLATALGVPGESSHPRVSDAIDRILTAARGHSGLWLLAGVGSAAEVSYWWTAGCQAFTYGHEYALLADAYQRALPDLRAAAPMPDPPQRST